MPACGSLSEEEEDKLSAIIHFFAHLATWTNTREHSGHKYKQCPEIIIDTLPGETIGPGKHQIHDFKLKYASWLQHQDGDLFYILLI